MGLKSSKRILVVITAAVQTEIPDNTLFRQFYMVLVLFYQPYVLIMIVACCPHYRLGYENKGAVLYFRFY